MFKGHLIRFGCVLALVFAASTTGPATAKNGSHACGGPPARPLAELRPLAEAGDAEAQYRLGHKYRFGRGPRENQAIAATWFRRAADQGHIAATGALGVMHVQGDGVPKDIAKGLHLMRRAASGGRVCSQSGLGFYYLSGFFDVPQDLDEAEKWLRLAAEEGHSTAQRFLAELYSGTFGGEADHVAALRWAIIREIFHPHDRIPKIIRDIRDRILPLMSAEQFAEAERGAKDWLARHGK